MNSVILDTGPLVAYLHRGDKYHTWAKKKFQEINDPFITCEAVISESCFIVKRIHHGSSKILEMLERKIIQVNFDINLEANAIKHLMIKYENIPMSFADACLVRMSELFERSQILTIDHDFLQYRKNKKSLIECIAPFESL